MKLFISDLFQVSISIWTRTGPQRGPEWETVVSHTSFFGQIIFAMENGRLVTLRCR